VGEVAAGGARLGWRLESAECYSRPVGVVVRGAGWARTCGPEAAPGALAWAGRVGQQNLRSRRAHSPASGRGGRKAERGRPRQLQRQWGPALRLAWKARRMSAAMGMGPISQTRVGQQPARRSVAERVEATQRLGGQPPARGPAPPQRRCPRCLRHRRFRCRTRALRFRGQFHPHSLRDRGEYACGPRRLQLRRTRFQDGQMQRCHWCLDGGTAPLIGTAMRQCWAYVAQDAHPLPRARGWP